MKKSRFAPSPTGHLHVGSARVALFCYLFAQKSNGRFVLRIEDTDRERSTQASIDVILEAMDWLGLRYDEGPFYQTEHFARYQQIIDKLMADGNAYRCYCSKDRLAQLRETQKENKQKPRYDGHCRDLNLQDESKPHVIRFKNPCEGEVAFEDQVYGKLIFKNSELDDLIIKRSDGTPTYNLTVVVDDMDMQITEVIRGDDHLNNTPRQINILKALGASLPNYAHLPMILGKDGKRLSKRHGAVSVLSYKEQGILPQALLNYLVRLGWSHGDQEVFSMQEMIALFSIEKVNKAAAAFDPDKLIWLNQHYIKTMPIAALATELTWHYRQAGVDLTQGPDIENVINALRERSKTLVEMVSKSQFLYCDSIEYDAEAMQKHIVADSKSLLQQVYDKLKQLDAWQAELIQAAVKEVVTSNAVKFPKVAQPIRIAATGSTNSPGIDVTLMLLGKEKTLARLKTFLLT